MTTVLPIESERKGVAKFRPLKPLRNTIIFAKKFNAVIYKEATRHLDFLQKVIFNEPGKTLEFMTVRKYINTLKKSTDTLVLEMAFNSYSEFKCREKKEVLGVLVDIERQIVVEKSENDVIVNKMSEILKVYMPKDILNGVNVNDIVSDNIDYFREKLIEERRNINKIFIMLWIYEQKLLKTPSKTIREKKDWWLKTKLL